MKLKLRRYDFERYLKRNSKEFFDRRALSSCPIACFLTRREDHVVEVLDDETELDGETYENPPWAAEFVTRWDKGKGINGRGSEAVRVLSTIPKRTAVSETVAPTD